MPMLRTVAVRYYQSYLTTIHPSYLIFIIIVFDAVAFLYESVSDAYTTIFTLYFPLRRPFFIVTFPSSETTIFLLPEVFLQTTLPVADIPRLKFIDFFLNTDSLMLFSNLFTLIFLSSQYAFFVLSLHRSHPTDNYSQGTPDCNYCL